jgi:hypothetical protein
MYRPHAVGRLVVDIVDDKTDAGLDAGGSHRAGTSAIVVPWPGTIGETLHET